VNRHQSGYGQIDPMVQEALERLGRGSDGRNAVQGDPDEGPAFDLRALLGLIRRQKWTILATVILGGGLGALYVSQDQRQYTASATLVVDSRVSEALGIEPGLNDLLGPNSVVGTEIEIIRSRAVRLIAAESLNLPTSPVFRAELSRLDSLLNVIGLGPGDPPDEPVGVGWEDLSALEQTQWADRLRSYIDIRQRSGTTAIEVSATTPFPTESADWANAMADAYIVQQIQEKRDRRQQVINALQDSVDAARADLEQADEDFETALRSAVDAAGTPAARAALDELVRQEQLRDAQQGRLAELEALLQGQDIDALAEEVAPIDPDLADQRVALQNELQTVTEEERIAAIEANIAALNDEIQNAAFQRRESLRTALSNQQQFVAATEQEFANAALEGLPNDEVDELLDLQAAVQSAETSLTNSEADLRIARVQGVDPGADAQIIESATPPLSPSYPSVMSTMIMALLLSGAAGFGIALMRENLTGGISNAEELEQDFGIPVVAAVPKFSAGRKSSPDWAIVDKPLSAYSEAIRRARIGVESVAAGQQLKLVVTSAVPGDGKTTMALSVARALAKTGKPTILIDADLRHPTVRQHTERETRAGLLDYLLQGRDGSHLFLTYEEATGLSLILGSEPSPVATDTLIQSERFARTVDYAADQFECIVFDTPPVGLVVDAQIIAREYANAALFVVKADATRRKAVEHAVHNLRSNSDVPILGILNQASSSRSYYGKYKNYYY